MSNLNTWLIIIAIAGITACSNDTASDAGNNNAQSTGTELELKLSGLEEMQGQHYEGWAIANNGVTSTGRFNVDNTGQIFAVNASGASLAKIGDNSVATFSLADGTTSLRVFVLTIEPDGDTDEGASSIHYVQGSFSNGVAIATSDASGSVGANFDNASGSYILATPTNGASTHNQGIWYLDSGNPSLQIPTLNSSWVYEGWIVDTTTGNAISTGTFSAANTADSDAAGASAGVNPAPPFPGQDFINPARVLNDGNHVAVISIEPVPDNDPAPFALKILASTIASGAPVTTSLGLNNISNQSDISVTATLK